MLKKAGVEEGDEGEEEEEKEDESGAPGAAHARDLTPGWSLGEEGSAQEELSARWVAAREHFAAGFDALRDHFLEGMDVLFGVAGEGSAGSKKESGREGSPEL